MYKFSNLSKTRLDLAHRDLQTLFHEVLKYRDCMVLESYRGEEAQNKARAAVNSTLSYPNSKHNKRPSLAIDVAPYPLPNMNDPKRSVDFVYFAGFVMGLAQKLYESGLMQYKVRCGADFNMNNAVSDSTLFDLVHFELLV
jgi:peptidoglycan L-alanyl-D-glutamate endopeptidase CwlK